MSRPGHSLVWQYKAGVPYKNRVRVYERAHSRSLMMEWASGGPHYVSLRHSNRARAKMQAEVKAAELLAARPRTHEPETRLMGMRADLVRVAADTGRPQGVAPSVEDYRRLGRWSDQRIRGAFRGFKRNRETGWVNARDTWTEAIHKFGLKTTRETNTPTYAKVAADVRRVALTVGKPGRMPTMEDVKNHGRYEVATIFRHLHVACWIEAADALQLSIDQRRRDHSAKIRRSHDRSGIEEQAA